MVMSKWVMVARTRPAVMWRMLLRLMLRLAMARMVAQILSSCVRELEYWRRGSIPRP